MNSDSRQSWQGVSEKDSTEKVYEKAVSPILENLLNGFNATIFAYGMTGAGKTYTMFGNMSSQGTVKSHPGLIMFTIRDLFRAIADLQEHSQFALTCSYMEIYNESVRDLLQENSGSLMILQDNHGETFVNELSEHRIRDPDQLFELIRQGNARRTMAATKANQFSSRSHALIQLGL